MPRRSKEDALATKSSLLDAAELLFQANGVSGTSLADIARQAGTTRGAIYWHFLDKADLFNSMMERVSLPLEAVFETLDDADADSMLERLRGVLRGALQTICTDARTRRVFEVATQKVEYIESLKAVRIRHLAVRGQFLTRMEQGLSQAATAQQIDLGLPVTVAACGLHALADGMIQNWLLDPEAFDLVTNGAHAFDVYLRGLGFRLNPLGAT